MASVADSENGAGEGAEFEALLSDLMQDPEKLNQLSGEELVALGRKIDPFAGIGGARPDPKSLRTRVAAISGINMREEYLRRLTMTSLVGFIFQLCEEWEVPEAQRVWVPEAKLAPEACTPLTPAALVERLEGVLAIAREAAAAGEEASAAERAALEADLVLPAGGDAAPVKALIDTAAAASAKSAGMLYAAMHALHRSSIDTSNRLRATAEAGMKFPVVRQIISRFPLPPAPGQVTLPPNLAKEIIRKFLLKWFSFDPSVHARAGHNAKTVGEALAKVQIGDAAVTVDTKDPAHLTLEALRAAAPRPTAANKEHLAALNKILESDRSKNAAIAMLRDDELLQATLVALGAEQEFQHYLFPVAASSPAAVAATVIPPQDTFHRWNYYTEVNYEELRTIAEALYPERADLEWAFGVWEVFEGTESEVQEKFRKHCERYGDQCLSSIRSVSFGGWTLQADFKENRKKIDFYNKNTEVLKRILDRHTEDKKTGAELMRNRIKQEKAANIAADGPDAPGLNRYKRELASKGHDLASKGVQPVISREQMLRLNKANGDVKAAQELELLEQHENTIKRLNEMKRLRELTAEEKGDLEHAVRTLPSVREMVNVPEDAIQVDVFSNNPATGEFGKSHFYTQAFAPEEEEQKSSATGSSHPAAAAMRPGPLPPQFVSPAQRPGQQLAPFAVQHILSELTPQSQEQQKAAATRAASGLAPMPVVIHAAPESA